MFNGRLPAGVLGSYDTADILDIPIRMGDLLD